MACRPVIAASPETTTAGPKVTGGLGPAPAPGGSVDRRDISSFSPFYFSASFFFHTLPDGEAHWYQRPPVGGRGAGIALGGGQSVGSRSRRAGVVLKSRRWLYNGTLISGIGESLPKAGS